MKNRLAQDVNKYYVVWKQNVHVPFFWDCFFVRNFCYLKFGNLAYWNQFKTSNYDQLDSW